MRQDRREGSGKSETVGQHIFRAGFAELFAKPFIPIENLPDNRLGVWRIYVSFFHRRARRKPSASMNVFGQLGKFGWVILLHQAVAVGPAEIKNIVRVLLEQGKVLVHGLAQVFVDDLRIFPAPFRVQVRVTDDVKRWFLAQIRLVLGLLLWIGLICRLPGSPNTENGASQ